MQTGFHRVVSARLHTVHHTREGGAHKDFYSTRLYATDDNGIEIEHTIFHESPLTIEHTQETA